VAVYFFYGIFGKDQRRRRGRNLLFAERAAIECPCSLAAQSLFNCSFVLLSQWWNL